MMQPYKLHSMLSEKKSNFDMDLINGNRVAVNTALQKLDSAIRNLSKADSSELRKNVKNLEKAKDFIIKYNKANV